MIKLLGSVTVRQFRNHEIVSPDFLVLTKLEFQKIQTIREQRDCNVQMKLKIFLAIQKLQSPNFQY